MAVQIVGSINIDIITSLERLPVPGETVLALATARSSGRKGSQPGGGRRADGRGDPDGRRGRTGRCGDLDVEFGSPPTTSRFRGSRYSQGEETGTAYIAVDAEGENQIVVVSGANARVKASAPVSDGVLLAQLEVPVAALLPLFAQSRAIRILNTAPALPEARSA
ncbi:MAG: hypothetical protein QM744_02455 [Mesorhizobium sp.]